jgi:hypothetical protein
VHESLLLPTQVLQLAMIDEFDQNSAAPALPVRVHDALSVLGVPAENLHGKDKEVWNTRMLWRAKLTCQTAMEEVIELVQAEQKRYSEMPAEGFKTAFAETYDDMSNRRGYKGCVNDGINGFNEAVKEQASVVGMIGNVSGYYGQ